MAFLQTTVLSPKPEEQPTHTSNYQLSTQGGYEIHSVTPIYQVSHLQSTVPYQTVEGVAYSTLPPDYQESTSPVVPTVAHLSLEGSPPAEYSLINNDGDYNRSYVQEGIAGTYFSGFGFFDSRQDEIPQQNHNAPTMYVRTEVEEDTFPLSNTHFE